MNIFTQIATTLFGLLSGGMVLIALGLVPYWMSLDPTEFATVFSSSLPTIGRAMAILTVLGTGTVVLAAGLAAWKKLPSRNWLILGAACALVMFATVPLYFGSANSLLVGGTLGAAETSAELATWQMMHWLRTILGVAGLFCAIRAGYGSK